MTIDLQFGQVFFYLNHGLIHSGWNKWEHGNFITNSSFVNPISHIEHKNSFSNLKLCTGNEFINSSSMLYAVGLTYASLYGSMLSAPKIFGAVFYP